MRFDRYTKKELIKAVNSSFSLVSVLRKLNIVVAGGNYQTLKNRIDILKLDISHFTGKGWLRNKKHNYNKRLLSEILVYGKYEGTHSLKLRLLIENVKLRQCESCKNYNWLNHPIPLELHHIDGDKKNNFLQNITLLCPNCHALTDNYRGKNKRRRDLMDTTVKKTPTVKAKPRPQTNRRRKT